MYVHTYVRTCAVRPYIHTCTYNSHIGMNAMCVHTRVQNTHTNVYPVSVTGCHCQCDCLCAILVGALYSAANSVLMPRLQ